MNKKFAAIILLFTTIGVYAVLSALNIPAENKIAIGKWLGFVAGLAVPLLFFNKKKEVK